MQAPEIDPPAPQEAPPEAPGEPSPGPQPDPAAARSVDSRPPRRGWIALLCALHAPVFAWAAILLPWRRWTLFAAATLALAALHAATAALTLVPHPLARRAFRATSFASLAYLGYLSCALFSSAAYVAALNRGLGSGVAAALLAVWAIAVLLTLPVACWGVASTGGLRPRLANAALVAAAAIAAVTAAWQHRRAGADAIPVPGGDPDRTAAALIQALPAQSALPAGPEKPVPLFTTAPAACAAPPAPARPTFVITHLAPASASGATNAPVVTSRCVQPAPGEDALAALDAAIAAGVRGPIKLDVLSAVQPLRSPGPALMGLALRPGLDGVCLAGSCLMPWQLVALDAFNTNMPLDGVPDVRFGIELSSLRRALGELPPGAGVAGAEADPEALRSGLLRIETLSFVVDDAGALHPLSRLGQPDTQLDAATLDAAARAAQRYILGAQRKDGMFRYIVDPFTGRASFDGFSVPRQAGTTLALCELGDGGPSAFEGDGSRVSRALRTTVQRSLGMLAKLERVSGDGSIGALVHPPGAPAVTVGLGSTALSLVAFLSCRWMIGPQHDALIGRLARMILAAQRADGGFAPELDLASATARPGPGQLYESGQSVLALTLLEALVTREPRSGLPTAETLKAAVDRAMEYHANRYWDHFLKDFLYLEENWHCLAARASLGHHRRDDYERFCLDYVAFKSRIVLDELSGVQPDFLGGYGFGNILPPHNTATAGFGEALAAAMALKEARGGDLSRDKALMGKVLGFLVKQQWLGPNCFACSRQVVIEGGFSEHMASPRIRIDYVQHAWAALGHGGRMLGLLPGRSAPAAVPL